MIELQEVSKIYDDSTVAVDSISFKVGKGEVFGLIGTSGCGKTTTLKMINRLVEATAGRILVDGEPVLGRPPEELRRNIGYVIQSIGLFPHYTIEQNISIVPRLLKWEEQRIEQRSRELLELVGMPPDKFAARKPDSLSGGQQQRVGLARALAGDPDLLLMDEPFGALDPITKEKVRQEFKNLLREINKTVILVTHDVFEAFDLCDRICLMDRGKARQTGTPKELLFQPADDFVRSFFDNHRLQLELMSITVGDVLESGFTPEGNVPGEGEKSGESVDKNTSLFSLLGASGEGRMEEDLPLTVENSEGNTLGFIDPDRLLEAFRVIRNKFREGSDG